MLGDVVPRNTPRWVIELVLICLACAALLPGLGRTYSRIPTNHASRPPRGRCSRRVSRTRLQRRAALGEADSPVLASGGRVPRVRCERVGSAAACCPRRRGEHRVVVRLGRDPFFSPSGADSRGSLAVGVPLRDLRAPGLDPTFPRWPSCWSRCWVSRVHRAWSGGSVRAVRRRAGSLLRVGRGGSRRSHQGTCGVAPVYGRYRMDPHLR